jgi:hypothetical protein
MVINIHVHIQYKMYISNMRPMAVTRVNEFIKCLKFLILWRAIYRIEKVCELY